MILRTGRGSIIRSGTYQIRLPIIFSGVLNPNEIETIQFRSIQFRNKELKIDKEVILRNSELLQDDSIKYPVPIHSENDQRFYAYFPLPTIINKTYLFNQGNDCRGAIHIDITLKNSAQTYEYTVQFNYRPISKIIEPIGNEFERINKPKWAIFNLVLFLSLGLFLFFWNNFLHKFMVNTWLDYSYINYGLYTIILFFGFRIMQLKKIISNFSGLKSALSNPDELLNIDAFKIFNSKTGTYVLAVLIPSIILLITNLSRNFHHIPSPTLVCGKTTAWYLDNELVNLVDRKNIYSKDLSKLALKFKDDNAMVYPELGILKSVIPTQKVKTSSLLLFDLQQYTGRTAVIDYKKIKCGEDEFPINKVMDKYYCGVPLEKYIPALFSTNERVIQMDSLELKRNDHEDFYEIMIQINPQ